MAFKNKDWVEETLKSRVPAEGLGGEETKAIEFTESLHRRDQTGQFSSTGTGGRRRPPIAVDPRETGGGGGGKPPKWEKPIEWEGDDDDSSSGVVTTPDGKKLRVRARKIKKPGYEKTPYRSSYTLDGKEQGRQYHPDMASAKARLLKIHAQLMAGKTAKGG